jgi:hypothetical protein
MPSHTTRHSKASAAPPEILFVWDNPGRVIDRNGYVVETSPEIWLLHDPIRFRQLDWTTINTASDIKEAMKAYAAYCIQAYEPATPRALFRSMQDASVERQSSRATLRAGSEGRPA